MCGFTTLSFPAIIRGAATSQNCGVHPPSLPSSFPSSIPPSLLPCFSHPLSFHPFLPQPPSLPTFLFKFLSPSYLFCPLFSLFFFSFPGAPPAAWSQLGVWGRAVSPAAKQFQLHSEVKTVSGDSSVEEVCIQRTYVTSHMRDQNLGCRTLQPHFWGVRIPTTPKVTAPLSMISKSKPAIWSFYFFK